MMKIKCTITKKDFFLGCMVAYYGLIAVCNPMLSGFNLSNFWIGLSFLLFAGLYNLRFDNLCIKNTSLLLYIFFVLVCAFYTFFSLDCAVSIRCFLKIILPLLLYYFLYQCCDTLLFLKVCDGIGYSNIFACIYSIYNFHFVNQMVYNVIVDGNIYNRMLGTFAQPNVLSAFLVLTLPFSFRIAYRYSKFLTFWLVCFNAYCLYYTYSRGAVLALLIGIFLFCLLQMKKNFSYQKICALLCVIAIIVLLIICFYEVIEKTIFRPSSDSLRWGSLCSAIEISLENSLLGHGFGIGLCCSNLEFQILDGVYSNLLLDIGMVGLILYMLFHGYLLRSLWNLSVANRNKTLTSTYIFLSCLVYLVLGCVESVLTNTLINHLFAVYMVALVKLHDSKI